MLNDQDALNILVLIDRAQISVKEAEGVVELKKKLKEIAQPAKEEEPKEENKEK